MRKFELHVTYRNVNPNFLNRVKYQQQLTWHEFPVNHVHDICQSVNSLSNSLNIARNSVQTAACFD